MSNSIGTEFSGWRLDAKFSDPVEIPTLATVDVVVVGAGASGVAAATIAAEQGLSVVLVEKYGFCGGAAVAGMSGTICGLYLAQDEPTNPEQIVFGFTERFARLLDKRGGLTGPQLYGKTWAKAHDPLLWREVADTFLTAALVRILFHTSVVGVLTDGDVHTGVVIESNAGRSLIRAARTIDASGDAAVIARAGHGTVFGDGGSIQNPTMFFRLGGVDQTAFDDYYGEDSICPPKVTDSILKAREGGLDLPRDKIWTFRTNHDGELLVNATRLTAADGRMLNVIDPEDFTLAEVLGRQQVRDYARFLVEQVPGCSGAYVIDTGVEAGIRQTRSILGVETLSDGDVVAARKRKDGIARSAWPIEVHSGERPKLHWILNDYYEVPYLTLVPLRGENVIVAGRCLSAQHQALASARVTAQCFEYGQAAALATIESLRHDVAYRDVPGSEVRAAMVQHGSDL